MLAKQSTALFQAAERLMSSHWDEEFSPTTFNNGIDYAIEGRVNNLSVQLAGNWFQVQASVQGTKSKPYNLKLHFAAIGPLSFSGQCTCPVGSYCKHMVAVCSNLEEFNDDTEDDQDFGYRHPKNQSQRSYQSHLSSNARRERAAQMLVGQGRIPRTTQHSKGNVLSLKTINWLSSITIKLAQDDQEIPKHFSDLQTKETGIYYEARYPKNWEPERGGLLKIQISRVKRLMSGGFSQPTRISTKSLSEGSFANYISWTEQSRIKQMLALSIGEDVTSTEFMFSPHTPNWSDLIKEMLNDRVLVGGQINPEPLKKGATLEIEPFWYMLKNKSVATGVRSKKTKIPVGLFSITPPIYVLPDTGTYGKAKIELPEGISITDWLAAPIISPTEFPAVNKHLKLPQSRRTKSDKTKNSNEEVALFPELPSLELVAVDGTEILPSGVLTLKRIDLPCKRGFYGVADLKESPVATLAFKYGDWLVENPMIADLQHSIVAEDRIVSVNRNLNAESELIAELLDSELGLLRDQSISFYYNTNFLENAFCFPFLDHAETVQKWAKFCTTGSTKLVKNGWEILIDDSFYFKVANPDAWYADLNEKEGSGIEWMSFDYGIEFEGRKISMISILAKLLSSHGSNFDPRTLLEAPEDETIPLFLEEEGLVIPVPARRLGEIYNSLTELLNYETGALTLHSLRAAQLVTDFGLNKFDDTPTLRRLAKLAEKISNFSGIEQIEAPKELNAELRSYQKEGLNWLQFLRDSDLNGILADDMGLGKTIQTLANIQVEKSSGRMKHPALIVAPTSVISNWVSEANRFTPTLKVLLLHGLDRKIHFDSIQEYDLVVTSYALLTRDAEIHTANQYHYAILDEAQIIKNPKSKVSQSACGLKTTHRLCLTGTPMENHLGELWSLVHYLMPGFLGTYDLFRKHWQNPIENTNDSFRRERLVNKISPILLRRTKDLVLKELPPRTDMVLDVTLDKTQSDLYEAVRAAMDKRVRDALKDKGLKRSHIIVLDALLKLRQICCHPQLLKTEAAKKVKHSAKLEVFEDLVAKQVEAGRKILVFSQFTSMISLIEKSLDKLKIGHVKLIGSTTNRKEVIAEFQEGKVPVFLISLKAGGSGLNLTTADCVIHYDPWWNPAVEEQATARAHRMGQVNPVFVYRLVTKGSIEERILELQAKKAALANAILSGGEINDDGTTTKALTQSDLEKLLAPLDRND